MKTTKPIISSFRDVAENNTVIRIIIPMEWMIKVKDPKLSILRLMIKTFFNGEYILVRKND